MLADAEGDLPPHAARTANNHANIGKMTYMWRTRLLSHVAPDSLNIIIPCPKNHRTIRTHRYHLMQCLTTSS